MKVMTRSMRSHRIHENVPSPEAIQHASDGRGLRQEAGAEGIPVYGLNRGAGALREVVTHDDDTRRIAQMKHGAREGVLPEIGDEDLVLLVVTTPSRTPPKFFE